MTRGSWQSHTAVQQVLAEALLHVLGMSACLVWGMSCSKDGGSKQKTGNCTGGSHVLVLV